MEWKEEWNLTNCSRSKEEKCSGKKRKRQKRGPRDIDLTNSTSVSNIMIYFDVRLQCFSWNEETTDKSVNKTVKGWFWILLESCEPFWPPVPPLSLIMYLICLAHLQEPLFISRTCYQFYLFIITCYSWTLAGVVFSVFKVTSFPSTLISCSVLFKSAWCLSFSFCQWALLVSINTPCNLLISFLAWLYFVPSVLWRHLFS